MEEAGCAFSLLKAELGHGERQTVAVVEVEASLLVVNLWLLAFPLLFVKGWLFMFVLF